MIERLLSVALHKPQTFASLVKSRFGSRLSVRRFHLDGMNIQVRAPTVLPLYMDIFDRCDYLAPGNPARILDLGANVGFASLFFAQRYPDATIDAIECDPELYRLLKSNLQANGITNVNIHEFAAWVEDGELSFAPDGGGGGRLAAGGGVSVSTVDMKKWLAGRPPYDLVKIDIEGAERALFDHIAEEIVKAKHVVVEYHSEVGKEQNLDEMLATLRRYGFRYYVKTEDRRTNPLFGCGQGMDNQLNIFAYR
jgi:FkbM family methyltransferase